VSYRPRVHRAAPECIARLDHISTAPRRHYKLPISFSSQLPRGGSKCEAAASRIKKRLNGQLVRGPGGDSTGASAEREGGLLDHQPKAELAQGEYKGAREALARHGRTAQPRDDPGGVLRTQRTTQPSWMCSFDDI
jgi:hypothetical protein